MDPYREEFPPNPAARSTAPNIARLTVRFVLAARLVPSTIINSCLAINLVKSKYLVARIRTFISLLIMSTIVLTTVVVLTMA